jgi:hypothetical protein
VEKNFPFDRTTATRYMQFAELNPELSNVHPGVHFNYKQMLKLAAPKEPAEPAENSGETDKPAEEWEWDFAAAIEHLAFLGDA